MEDPRESAHRAREGRVGCDLLVLVVHNARLPPDVHRVVRGEQHVILAVPLLVPLLLVLLRRQLWLRVDPIGPLGFLRSRREARRAQAELPSPYRGLDVVAGDDARRRVLLAVIARRPMERLEIGEARARPAEVPRHRRRGSRGVVMMMEVLDLQVTPRPRVAVQRLQAVVRGQRGHYEDGEVTRGAPSDPRHGSRPRPPAARL